MRNTWLVGGVAGFVVALGLMRGSSRGVAADAPAPVQKWEYATFEERVNPAYYAWHSPRSKLVWGINFPDFYKEMGGKGDATEAGNAELYNLVGLEGWEYVGVEDFPSSQNRVGAIADNRLHSHVFKRPAR